MIIMVLIISILFICFKKVNTRVNNVNKYISIYDVVKEAFITEEGYSNKLSKHISKEVINKVI
ncbi:hypothetical protein [Clostridium sp. L74]|uniref:hypothetical protein n=1 Tax=Clostridium sp. L74 TaxID=1560217 RepID=UPI00192A07D5|nr:hypothetical protein [Clostridium sp. L74]